MMQEDYKKSLLKLITRSDRLDMIIKSSGYGFSFWASLASIAVSTIMVLASLVGIYLAAQVSVEGVRLAETTFTAGALKVAVVAAFVVIYVIFEFLKTYAFKAFISSFSFNGAFLVFSIACMSIGYLAQIDINPLKISLDSAKILFFGGVVLFMIANAIAILHKKKSKEWYVIFGIVGVVAVTGSTVMANMKTIEIVDRYESTRFDKNLMSLGTVAEAKSDKKVAEKYIADIRSDIRAKKREISDLKSENRKKVKQIKKGVFIDRQKALNEQSWKFRTRLKALQADLRALEKEREGSVSTFMANAKKVDQKIDQERTNFETKREKYYKKAAFIAVWGEIICSFFIALSVIVHVLNPNIKGASTIQEEVSDSKDNDIDIKRVKKLQKSKKEPLKTLLSEERQKGNL